MKTTVSRLQIAGYNAQAVTFTPDSEVKAGAVLIHGQGDFIERYHSVADIFCRYGIKIIGIDLPGHGETSGTKGDIPSVQIAEKFIDTAYHKLLENTPKIPIGILSHSVGALLGMRELLINKREYKFAWLSGPFLHPEKRKSILQIGALQILAKVIPSLTISTGVKRSHCRQSIGSNRDPLFHSSISLRWGLELLGLSKSVRTDATVSQIKIPILVTQGQRDSVSPTELNTSFFRELNWDNLEYKVISDALHETFLDTPEAFEEIVTKWNTLVVNSL